jgi:quercetin dioxygenase-like cupin family protein
MNGRSLSQLCEETLANARASSSGRAAVTVFGGQEHDMRQTLIALRAGALLHEHEAPSEATLHVLVGDVRVRAGSDQWQGSAGDYLIIPAERHELEATSDAAVLLTVATRA